MKKVNTTYWKIFKVEDLFEILKGSAKYGKKDITDNGHIPVYSSETDNNGIIGYCEKKPTYLVDESHPLYLIFGDHTCAFHIANSDFCVADNVKILLPKNQHLSIKSLQFISTIWKAGIPNLGYSRHWSVAKKVLIPLPSTSDGSPDWQFMEDYMRRIEQRTKTAISAFVSSKYSQRKIDTTYWKEFVIEDLFEKLELKFKPKKFIKTKHVSTERTEEFNIPLVNAKHSNNGIMYYGREKDFESEEMTIDIVADGAASTGDVYPQPQRTGVLYNAYLIKLKDKKSSKAVLCFLSTIIERCVKQKFGYDNKCTWDKVKKEKILLPATPAGEPDGRYMEMYMRGVEAIVKNKLNLLAKKENNNELPPNSLVNYGTVNIYEK